MNYCTKFNCSNRTVLGHSNDEDSISYVCSKCNRLYYYSENRSKRTKKVSGYIFFLTLFLVLISSIIYFNFFGNSGSSQYSEDIMKIEGPTPLELTQQFFYLISEGEISRAYNLTDNVAWSPFSKFDELWSGMNEIKFLDHQPKNYPSRFDSDTILEITYRSVDHEGKVNRENFDFHYKKYTDGWRIVRMIFSRPRDFYSPDVKLASYQKPKTPHSAMVQFFRFLDKREFKKAHLLTFNSSWGNYEQFVSREKGWVAITSLNVSSIKKVYLESDYGSEVFYCRYETYENYGSEANKYEFIFHLDKINGKWKILKATYPPDDLMF